MCLRVILGEKAPGLCTQRWPYRPLGEKTNGIRNQFLQMGHRTSPATTLKTIRAESRAASPALSPAYPSQGPPEAADVTTNNPSLCVGVRGGRDRLHSAFSSCAALASPIRRSSEAHWLGRHSWWPLGSAGGLLLYAVTAD